MDLSLDGCPLSTYEYAVVNIMGRRNDERGDELAGQLSAKMLP